MRKTKVKAKAGSGFKGCRIAKYVNEKYGEGAKYIERGHFRLLILPLSPYPTIHCPIQPTNIKTETPRGRLLQKSVPRRIILQSKAIVGPEALQELVELAVNHCVALYVGLGDEAAAVNDELGGAQRAQVVERVRVGDDHVGVLPHLD